MSDGRKSPTRGHKSAERGQKGAPSGRKAAAGGHKSAERGQARAERGHKSAPSGRAFSSSRASGGAARAQDLRRTGEPFGAARHAASKGRDGNLIYGRHPILALLQVHPDAILELQLLPQHLQPDSHWAAPVQAARAAGVAVSATSLGELEARVGDAVHQGAVAQVRPFVYASLEACVGQDVRRALVLVLDQIVDPHNLGALTRSAAALGATGVVIGKDRCAEMNATAIKASAGAAYALPVAQVVNVRRALDSLHERGLWVAGLAAEGTTSLQELDWNQGMALVVGAEGEGLRPLVAEGCDWLVSVPIARVGSLNASVAGAIGLYAASTQRLPPLPVPAKPKQR